MKPKNKNLIVMPSRGRPVQAKAAAEAALALSSTSELVIVADIDDPCEYKGQGAYELLRIPRVGLTGTLNEISWARAEQFETITFLADDNIVRTQGWDEILLDPILSHGLGISYGDDLNPNVSLPTSVMMSSNIIMALGHMAPRGFKHMFIDNYWHDLGLELDCLFYNPAVVIEHMHFSLGKSSVDQTYRTTNKHLRNVFSRLQYAWYKQARLRSDAKQIRQSINL